MTLKFSNTTSKLPLSSPIRLNRLVQRKGEHFSPHEPSTMPLDSAGVNALPTELRAAKNTQGPLLGAREHCPLRRNLLNCVTNQLHRRCSARQTPAVRIISWFVVRRKAPRYSLLRESSFPFSSISFGRRAESKNVSEVRQIKS